MLKVSPSPMPAANGLLRILFLIVFAYLCKGIYLLPPKWTVLKRQQLSNDKYCVQ